MPTPRKVTQAIGRGEINEAVSLLSQLLNEDVGISRKKFERVLEALGRSHKFTLDHADKLFYSLEEEMKPVLLTWYSQQYLRFSESRMKEADLILQNYKRSQRRNEKQILTAQQLYQDIAELYNQSRQIWKRYQKIRKESFPGLVEPTPVLGIIDLREAEVLVKMGLYSKAHLKLKQAQKKLSLKVPFDRVKRPIFKRLIKQLQRKIKEKK